VFTTARHWSLWWARCIQFTPSHHVSLRYILNSLLRNVTFSLHLALFSSSGADAIGPHWGLNTTFGNLTQKGRVTGSNPGRDIGP
jgi:hypothetical protein